MQRTKHNTKHRASAQKCWFHHLYLLLGWPSRRSQSLSLLRPLWNQILPSVIFAVLPAPGQRDIHIIIQATWPVQTVSLDPGLHNSYAANSPGPLSYPSCSYGERMGWMPGEELFPRRQGGRAGGNWRMGFKATLSATSGMKEPKNRPSFRSEVCNSECRRHAPALGSPWPPPLLCKPKPGHVHSEFYLSLWPAYISKWSFCQFLGHYQLLQACKRSLTMEKHLKP